MSFKFDVFVSYSRKDSAFVHRLVHDLSRAGLKVFYDVTGISTGDSLARSIEQAVSSSRNVIAVMSPDYFESSWATAELQMALVGEIDTKGRRVIPVYYRDCQIPLLLQTRMYADFRNERNYQSALEEVLSVFGGRAEEPSSGDKPRRKAAQSTDELADARKAIQDLRATVEAFMASPKEHKGRPSQSKPHLDPKLCFVVMPFGSEDLNIVYEDFIKPSIEAHCGLRCERGDDVFGSNVIMDDIRRSIEQCRLVIADLSGRNPNVFYEVGIAHTLDKDVLLLAQSMNDVPFDLRHRRVLIYDYSPRGCKRLETAIVEHVKSILSNKA